MKSKKRELNVDFIGGQEPLTEEEEKALSDFFSKKKLAAKKAPYSKRSASQKGNFEPPPRH